MSAAAPAETTLQPAPPREDHVVLPPLRNDLLVTQQTFEGRNYYVVKDPISLQYFRMTAEDYQLATLFDGRRNFAQIRDEYLRRFPHVRLDYTPDELKDRLLRFSNDLALMRFLAVQGQRLKAQYDAMKEKKKKKGLYELVNQVFFYRRSLIDPDVVFGRWAKKVSWVWTNTTAWLSLALIIAAIVVFMQHTDRLDGAFANLFSFHNVLLMWVTTMVIKSIHELGHGLTCKHYGGEVHEVGVMFMVFTPYFFVNVSDSWTMPNRRHRILVSFAGIYVELIFAAVATFFWAILQPGTLRDFMFNVIFIASVSTIIFNANPLMRFDGYYIMMDALEVPNLQTKSRALINHHLKRLFFGQREDPILARMPLPRRRLWIFYPYAILSWIYGYYVIYSLTAFMEPTLAPIGLEAAANWFSFTALLAWIVMPFIGFFKSMQITNDDWKTGGRMRRLFAILAATTGIIGALCFLPWEHKIKRSLALELAQPQQIRAESPGFITHIPVKEGQTVQPGQLIARLENREVLQSKIDAEAKLKSADIEATRYRALDRLAEMKQAELIRDAYTTRLQQATRDLDALQLKATTPGTILTPKLDQQIGRLLKTGDLICEISTLDPMRIMIALSEKEIRHIKKGQPVTLRIATFPDRTFQGTVAEDKFMFFEKNLPPAFSNQRGGDVPTYTDTNGQHIPTERTYAATVEIKNPGNLLRPGMTGIGRIHTGKKPLGQIWAQALLDLISLDYRL